MASGKSTLGKRVARKLDVPFLDMDKAIEEKFDLTIAEIFSTLGETAFRKAETDFLMEMKLDEETTIIATGGGVPCFEDNMDKMNEHGLTIYLKRPVKELAHRIFNSKKSRPLTDNLSEEELIEFIEDHLKERAPHYDKSKLIIERDAQTTQGILDALLLYSSAFLNSKKR